jgi:trimethylamine---corrinoid protein Co-methyltransferase
MALSDGKSLDAQAGGETFSSALLAAIAGVNSVSGPGMLDFVLTFSLPKLVFDNEVCGQCLHFVRDLSVVEDLPTQTLVADLLANDHLITSPHTLSHWPQELYLTAPVIDRENRETWEKAGPRSCTSAPARKSRHACRRMRASRPTRPSMPRCAA